LSSAGLTPDGGAAVPTGTPLTRPPLIQASKINGYVVFCSPCAGIIPEGGAGVPTGTPLTRPPLIEAISEDPILCRTKLIAEAWDCGPLMQAGS